MRTCTSKLYVCIATSTFYTHFTEERFDLLTCVYANGRSKGQSIQDKLPLLAHAEIVGSFVLYSFFFGFFYVSERQRNCQ